MGSLGIQYSTIAFYEEFIPVGTVFKQAHNDGGKFCDLTL